MSRMASAAPFSQGNHERSSGKIYCISSNGVGRRYKRRTINFPTEDISETDRNGLTLVTDFPPFTTGHTSLVFHVSGSCPGCQMWLNCPSRHGSLGLPLFLGALILMRWRSSARFLRETARACWCSDMVKSLSAIKVALLSEVNNHYVCRSH